MFIAIAISQVPISEIRESQTAIKILDSLFHVFATFVVIYDDLKKLYTKYKSFWLQLCSQGKGFN